MFKLLSTANPKTQKGVKLGYLTYILHLAPSDVSGVINTCPWSSTGCRNSCLNTAGRGGILKKGESTNKIQQARIRKTVFFKSDRTNFMQSLFIDIDKAIKYASKKGLIPTFRLNGTSDIPFESIKLNGKTVFDSFPNVQFYDYTKGANRKISAITNYHLTFSRNESNHNQTAIALANGMNVAMVFDKTPTTYFDLQVINGDDTDLRFLDASGVIVGLKAKGKAKHDTSGFVIRTA